MDSLFKIEVLFNNNIKNSLLLVHKIKHITHSIFTEAIETNSYNLVKILYAIVYIGENIFLD